MPHNDIIRGMEIKLCPKSLVPINDQEVEIVERKGLGHPDTLSDILANTFSRRYSLFTLDRYGSILNHYVDKVTLVGSKAELAFGEAKIVKPMTAYLFGKANLHVGNDLIDIEDMFQDAVGEVFTRVFRTREILNYVQHVVNIHDGVGLDHPKGFYAPQSHRDMLESNNERRSNDTVFCSAYAPYSEIEILTIKTENYLNSEAFKREYPETGFDIKVLTTRLGRDFVDITTCIPFIASLTPSMPFYKRKLKDIEEQLMNQIKGWSDYKRVTLNINTKDEGEKYAYLTVYGSALDKGDQGAVGRGNRFNGVISATREMNVEAAAGKNPLHHSGKIYNFASYLISKALYDRFSIHNTVLISARNGDLLSKPSFVIIKTAEDVKSDVQVGEVVKEYLDNLDQITMMFVENDPIKEHAVQAFRK